MPQVSVSETLVWRVVDLLRRLDLGRLSAGGDGDGAQTSSDIPIQAWLPPFISSPAAPKHSAPAC